MDETLKNEVTEIIVRIIKRETDKGMSFEAAKNSAFKALVENPNGQMLLSAWVDAI